MAYIGTVEYDDSGTIRTLEGMGVVTYDDGRLRNLSGQPLGAVKYDDGGRFRTLVGLGQDDIPIDLPLAPPQDVIPIDWQAPNPSGLNPVVDTTSITVPGTLVDTTPSVNIPAFGIAPTYNPDTTSIPVPGQLTPPAALPSSAGTLVSAVAPVTGLLTSILNAFKGNSANPATTVPGAVHPGMPTTGSSWFTQSSSMVPGIANWELIAGVGVLGLVIVSYASGGGGGSSRKRNPHRRNPMELVLMGANPRRRRRAR